MSAALYREVTDLQQVGNALRKLSDAQRKWTKANVQQAWSGLRGVPLAEFHALQEAKDDLTAIALRIYPEGP